MNMDMDNENNLRVNTIYPSFMGECNVYGIGVPCTFVRLAGCNLRCYHKTKGCFCDTPEALSVNSGEEMSIADIIYDVVRYRNKVICLTGGEPLLQENVKKLVVTLVDNGFKVVIETNGSKNIYSYNHIRNVSFVVDVKSPSSGEADKMLESNYSLLDENDFIKFVIDTEEDFDDFAKWLSYHEEVKCNIAVGLFWGSKVDYKWLLKNISSLNREVYLNMQTHKMTCMYDFYKDNKSFKNLFIPKEL